VVGCNNQSCNNVFAVMLKILSRNKPAKGPAAAGQTAKEKEKKDLPKLEDFLQARDYSGAMTLLEVRVAFSTAFSFSLDSLLF